MRALTVVVLLIGCALVCNMPVFTTKSQKLTLVLLTLNASAVTMATGQNEVMLRQGALYLVWFNVRNPAIAASTV